MRILFLHGYQQSPAIIQDEAKFLPSFLESVFGGHVELLYPQAPFVSTSRSNKDSTYSWWPEDDELDHAATFAYLSEILDSSGPFDGVIGFSQGASVGSLLAALLEQPQDMRPVAFSTTHTAFRFVVSFSGYREEDVRVRKYYEPRISTPILHFISASDPILSEERCLRLVDSCEDADGRVVIYPGSGNHRIPSTKATKASLSRFLVDFTDPEVC